MRDEETAIVGGICSGLSAYFGVEDPVWMRLIFVLLSPSFRLASWIPALLVALDFGACRAQRSGAISHAWTTRKRQ